MKNTNENTEKVREFKRYNFSKIQMTDEVVAMINANIVFLETTNGAWDIKDQIKARKRGLEYCEYDIKNPGKADANESTLKAWSESHIKTIAILTKLEKQF